MTTEREVSRALEERHAGIEPDAAFVARVIAALPRREEWTLGWAARRVLPASLAVAAALSIAVLMSHDGTRTPAAGAASAPAAASDSGSDPLDWLLETRR